MARLDGMIKAGNRERRRSPIPTTPPHPIPGGEYDRDGFLYRLHVMEGLRHDRVRQVTAALLRPDLLEESDARVAAEEAAAAAEALAAHHATRMADLEAELQALKRKL